MRKAIGVVLMLGIVIGSVVPSLSCVSFSCMSDVDVDAAEAQFDRFMKALATRDADTTWEMCYQPAFSGREDIEMFLDQSYTSYLENYVNLEFTKSEGGKLKGDSSIRGKTGAVLEGHVNYTDGRQLNFNAVMVEINDEWKVAGINIQ